MGAGSHGYRHTTRECFRTVVARTWSFFFREKNMNPLIDYIDSLFISGNSIPVARIAIGNEQWSLIKECLTLGVPFNHDSIEKERIRRATEERRREVISIACGPWFSIT